MGLVEYGGSDGSDAEDDDALNSAAAAPRPVVKPSSSKTLAGVKLKEQRSTPLRKSASPPVYEAPSEPVAGPSHLAYEGTPSDGSLDLSDEFGGWGGEERQSLPWPLSKFGISRPDPNAEADPVLEVRLAGFHEAREQGGESFNSMLMRNKMFRNPRILSKLVSFIDVDDKGSNFGQMWDRDRMLLEGSAKVIGEQQRKMAEEREAAKGSGRRSAIDFTSGSSKPSSSSSRWDSRDSRRDKDRDRDRGRDRDDRHHDKQRRRSRSPHGRHSSSSHR